MKYPYIYTNKSLDRATGTRYAAASARANKSRVAMYHRNRIRFLLLVVIAVVTVIGFSVFLHPKTEGIASAGRQTETRYRSILVEDSMTLSSIADQYDTSALVSRRDYIKQVKQINHINANDIILKPELLKR